MKLESSLYILALSPQLFFSDSRPYNKEAALSIYLVHLSKFAYKSSFSFYAC